MGSLCWLTLTLRCCWRCCRSSWNHFGGNGSHGNGRLGATMLQEIADAMVSSGLRDAGYVPPAAPTTPHHPTPLRSPPIALLRLCAQEYVNLDAGAWAPKRSPSGQILADPAKFPSGMAALASKVHALKLKFGVCESAMQRVGRLLRTPVMR